jgi:predicted nucleic acid-binding protein
VTEVRYLADVSAFASYRAPEVAAVLEPLIAQGRLATCAFLELQILGSIRNPDDYSALARYRRTALVWLPVEDRDLHWALEIQAALRGRDEHLTWWPKLLTAALAERHGLVLLHDDPDLELVAGVTGQSAQHVLPKGRLNQEPPPPRATSG